MNEKGTDSMNYRSKDKVQQLNFTPAPQGTELKKVSKIESNMRGTLNLPGITGRSFHSNLELPVEESARKTNRNTKVSHFLPLKVDTNNNLPIARHPFTLEEEDEAET